MLYQYILWEMFMIGSTFNTIHMYSDFDIDRG